MVASFYPLAYIVQRVGGDRVRVTNLTPPGAEPHDLELSPGQLEAMDTAAVVVVLGEGFQPSAEKAAATRKGQTILALSTALGPAAMSAKSGGIDPHIWLDPTLLPPVVEAVQQALASVDAGYRVGYEANAVALENDLADLDARYASGLATCKRRTIVTSHDAFERMAARYDFTTLGIAGFSPDAEPSPDRLAQLSELVQKAGVTTIFTERLVSSAIADTLARETGATVKVLDPLESAPKGGDYLSAMTANLASLRDALDCSERTPGTSVPLH